MAKREVRVYHGTLTLVNPKRPAGLEDITSGSLVAASLDKLMDKLVWMAGGLAGYLDSVGIREFNRLMELGNNHDALDEFCKAARRQGLICSWSAMGDTLQYDE